ncbi:DUF6233 domain-containing protein [Streptomyces albidochromogenes]|uniref:DUF6233 domain-containing protein n=1 Tax=Streptomyces albidochromogenes TaxID=329524 RepID=A0ABW6FPQ2_9ACTN
MIQLGSGEGRTPIAVHVGRCGLGGGHTRATDRVQALRALWTASPRARCASPTGTSATSAESDRGLWPPGSACGSWPSS